MKKICEPYITEHVYIEINKTLFKSKEFIIPTSKVYYNRKYNLL